MTDSTADRSELVPKHLARIKAPIRYAIEPWEIEAARRIRRDVFVVEQNLFEVHDRDAIDEEALLIIATCKPKVHQPSDSSSQRSRVTGTVRIHFDAEFGCWFGSRLAVLADSRGSARTASSLIRKAVATACVIGCRDFRARIQPKNLRLFQRLGWHLLGAIEHVGQPHLLMQAELERFQPSELLTAIEIQWARFLGCQRGWANTHFDEVERGVPFVSSGPSA
ncbi:MAG: MSMEG_0567/Sll0786 family nitrogen starvation N-acetyltransferase [Planctomycetota bacterium]